MNRQCDPLEGRAFVPEISEISPSTLGVPAWARLGAVQMLHAHSNNAAPRRRMVDSSHNSNSLSSRFSASAVNARSAGIFTEKFPLDTEELSALVIKMRFPNVFTTLFRARTLPDNSGP